MTPKNTIRLAVSAESIEASAAQRALAQAAAVLRAGGTVAFPTETVYGLGANALDAQAIAGIFIAKQRPAWDPLIVHVSDPAMLRRVAASVSPRSQKLIDAFWPGPLTLLLPRLAAVPHIVTAGRALVGVRMPSHPVAQALIAAADLPLAAPSANRFGHTSPTTAQHVLDDLDGRIDLLLDTGPTSFGVESTVVEVGEQSILLYRPGAVTAEQIEAVAGPVVFYEPAENRDLNLLPESLPSPGVGIRHYAPNASVIPVNVGNGPEADQQALWARTVQENSAEGLRVGLMLPTDWPLPEGFSGVRYEWGCWESDHELAQRLFAGLRALDAMGAELILCPLPSNSGLGAAIKDRLLKAAREK
jgi:L-threonylcarbamoyladenylate synthase